MEKQNNKTHFGVTLSTIAIFFAIIGLGIVIVFLGSLSRDFTIWGNSSIILDKTGQVGDFIGGVVGSIWAFSGVLLFYQSLILQRKEFQSQREALNAQKNEFRINRLTGVIFQQVARIDSVLKDFVVEDPDEHKRYIGNSGVYWLSEKIRPYATVLLLTSEINRDAKSILMMNMSKMYELFDVVLNSLNVTNLLIENNEELTFEEKRELKMILNQNIGKELISVVNHILKIVDNFLYVLSEKAKVEDMKKENVKYSNGFYFDLDNERELKKLKKILEMIIDRSSKHL